MRWFHQVTYQISHAFCSTLAHPRPSNITYRPTYFTIPHNGMRETKNVPSQPFAWLQIHVWIGMYSGMFSSIERCPNRCPCWGCFEAKWQRRGARTKQCVGICVLRVLEPVWLESISMHQVDEPILPFLNRIEDKWKSSHRYRSPMRTNAKGSKWSTTPMYWCEQQTIGNNKTAQSSLIILRVRAFMVSSWFTRETGHWK